MKTLPAMADMARSQKDKEDSVAMNPIDAVPDYPYGLCISLCETELEKLDVDPADIGVGDMVHLVCMATVTSKSERDSSCRIELQITHIAAEDEDNEYDDNEETEPKKKDIPSRLYKA